VRGVLGKRYLVLSIVLLFSTIRFVYAQSLLDGMTARPPVHVILPTGIQPFVSPTGLSPATIRAVYNLPTTGGSGTIAIIDAYEDASITNDFNAFSLEYGLPTATTTNFEIHLMDTTTTKSATTDGWDLEEALDVEWSHAIAPNAKILFVECKSPSTNNLLAGVAYASSRTDVVAISMSWGSDEFSGENIYDTDFISVSSATYFASAGDSGTGVEWPSVSVNVTGVGGTLLSFGATTTETAWSGSGGGLSAYESEPSYQTSYGVPSTNGFRAVPDVSYNGASGSAVSVIDTLGYGSTNSGWIAVYGTSCGSPQWAAIQALGGTANNTNFYARASSAITYAQDFRDIKSGTNGSCGFFCTATVGYDYVTGLGSPLTTNFASAVPVELSIFEMDSDLP
jgi:subtilase family serine protease